MTNSELLTTRT